jgi:hypothetical protein
VLKCTPHLGLALPECQGPARAAGGPPPLRVLPSRAQSSLGYARRRRRVPASRLAPPSPSRASAPNSNGSEPAPVKGSWPPARVLVTPPSEEVGAVDTVPPIELVVVSRVVVVVTFDVVVAPAVVVVAPVVVVALTVVVVAPVVVVGLTVVVVAPLVVVAPYLVVVVPRRPRGGGGRELGDTDPGQHHHGDHDQRRGRQDHEPPVQRGPDPVAADARAGAPPLAWRGTARPARGARHCGDLPDQGVHLRAAG